MEATTFEANQIGTGGQRLRRESTITTTTITIITSITGRANTTGGTIKIGNTGRTAENGVAAKTTHGSKMLGAANGREASKMRQMIHCRMHPETHGTHKTIYIRRLTATEMVNTLNEDLMRKADAKVGAQRMTKPKRRK